MAEVAAGLANSYFSAVVLSSSGFFSKFNNFYGLVKMLGIGECHKEVTFYLVCSFKGATIFQVLFRARRLYVF